MKKLILLLCKHGIDWDYVVQNAISNTVGTMLYHTINSIEADHIIPSELMSRLKQYYDKHKHRHRIFCEKLKEINDVFTERGIPFVLLKGGVLAHTVYSDMVLRPMEDIDILVHEHDLPEIERIMDGLNYTLKESRHTREFYRKYHFHLVYMDAANNDIKIEIHWDIVSKSSFHRFDLSQLWQDTRKETILDMEMLSFSPEDMLLHLCSQIEESRFSTRIIRFYDIKALLLYYKDSFNWHYLIEKANQYQLTTIVYYSLYFTKRLLQAPIPEDILNRIKPGSYVRALFESIITEKCILNKSIILRDCTKSVLRMLLINRHQDKLRFLGRILFPDAEHIRKIYHLTPDKLTSFFTRVSFIFLRIRMLTFMGYIVMGASCIFILSRMHVLQFKPIHDIIERIHATFWKKHERIS